jgi:hypothetical protein
MLIYSSFQIISLPDVKSIQFFREQDVSKKTHSRGGEIRTPDLPDLSGRAIMNQSNQE